VTAETTRRECRSPSANGCGFPTAHGKRQYVVALAAQARLERRAAKAPSEESSKILVPSLGGLAAWRLSSFLSSDPDDGS
jgi:hypothetical protein